MIRKLIFLLIVLTITLAALSFRQSNSHLQIEFKPFTFEPFQTEGAYSFFVAGHVYGAPGTQEFGFYPPFKESIQQLQNSTSATNLGVLTGDIVQDGSQKHWDAIRSDISDLNLPLYIALGNHDTNAPTFEQGKNKDFFDFKVGKDVFIILNSNLDLMNISAEQLNFLRNTLSQSATARNIFIFTHHLIWWAPESRFSCVSANARPVRSKPSNFETDIMPLLKNFDKNIFWFAGDTGAFAYLTPMYVKDANVHLLASGMGGGNGNYLVVTVGDYVDIELIWLHDIGPETDPDTAQFMLENKPSIEEYNVDCSVE